MQVKEIPINKIKIFQNIRTALKDVSELMRSMEHSGLQHPIGVWAKGENYTLAYGHRRLNAAKKLSWKTIPAVIIAEEFTEENFLIANTIENIHRENISPVELGNICQLFIDKGFSLGEVAAKLHFNLSRIESAHKIYRNVPEKYKHLIGYIDKGSPDNEGKIPADVVSKILSFRMAKEKMKEILDVALTQKITSRQVYLIEKLLRAGFSVKDAFKMLDNVSVKHIWIAVDNREVEKIDRPLIEYIRDIISGDEKPNKKLLIR